MSNITKLNLGGSSKPKSSWRFVEQNGVFSTWQAQLCDNEILGAYTVIIDWDKRAQDGYAHIERNFENVYELEIDHSEGRIRSLEQLKAHVYSAALDQLLVSVNHFQTALSRLST